MTDHVGESAALYALGILNDDERIAVEGHIANCESCAAVIALAEDDVTVLAASGPRRRPPAQLDARMRGAVHAAPRRSFRANAFAALAAAIAIAVVPVGYLLQENAAMRAAMVADASAMARVASTPHRTIAFAGMPGADARVMYGMDGSWYCIVVRGIRRPVDVAWMHDGRRTMLGTTQLHGDVAVLYLPQSHRMDRLALVEDSAIMGNAQLVF